ncbi:MAG: tetratricopeptide repeat protein [Gemmatimonadota bacterium]|nr:MAG: tetratricopeptide repeat protein [Gemmatimonadota bacterium]
MPPDYDDVRKEIDQLEQRFAENSQGLVFAHLADAYRRAGEYAKAEGLVLHGLKNHPNYISAYNVLGRIYLDSERFADAHEQFSKVLELDPHNLIALRALGDLAVEAGHPDDARSWYERMLLVDPRNDQVREEIRKLESAVVARPAEPAAPAEEAPEEVAQSWLGREAEAGPLPGREAEAEVFDAEDIGAEDEQQPWEIVDVLERNDDLSDTELVVEPVEGLVTKESMSKLEQEVAAAEPQPWDEVPEAEETETPAAQESDSGPEAEAPEFLPLEVGDVPTEPAAAEETAADSFLDDTLDVDFELLDDWSGGFFEEKGADAVEPDSAIEELATELGFEFGDETAEREPEAAAPETGPPEVMLPEPDAPERGEQRKRASGMVTETLARVYADQGLYEDALRVYRQLAQARPEDERIQARIAELEQQLSAEPSADREIEELAQLLELTEPTSPISSEVVPEESTADFAEEPAIPGQVLEPPVSTEPPEGEFQFEDEAPVAGFEVLDPFAASFDVLARREMKEARAAKAEEPAAEEEAGSLEPAMEVEPQAEVVDVADLAPTPEELAEPDALPEFVEPAQAVTPEPEFAIDAEMASFDEPELEAEAVRDLAGDEEEEFGWEPELLFAEDREAEDEAVQETESPVLEFITGDEETEELEPEPVVELEDGAPALDSAADVLAPSETELPSVDILERDESVEPVGAMATPEPDSISEERIARTPTIEDYLSRLLAYVPGQPQPSQGPLFQEPPVKTDQADPGDIEEFQDWLRSLKR